MELRTDRFKLKDILPGKAKTYAQKLHRKADDLEFVRKMIPIDPKDIRIEEKERAAIKLVSTPRLDRDKEILIPDGAVLDDFRSSPSVLWAHDYQGLPIGKDVWIKPTAQGILSKTVYANHAFADDVYNCVKGGFLNSNSVGFIPVDSVSPGDKEFGDWQTKLEKDYGVAKDESKDAKRIYTKWIMLEHSDVPVASNAQSLNLAVAKGDLKINSAKMIEDLEIKLDEFEPLIEEPIAMDEGAYRLTATQTSSSDIAIDTITKPETTENYHRIPVSSGHDGHRIRTITVSAEKGIKAIYCGECKEIATYLFDVEKWTMDEAKAWIKEHKDDKFTIEAETKTFDMQANPSVWDIQFALGMALNPPSETSATPDPYKSVVDFYPVNYPDGHCVYAEMDAAEVACYLQKYRYNEGKAIFSGEPQEVIVAYKKKALADMKRIDEILENQETLLGLFSNMVPDVPPEQKIDEIKLDASPEITIEASEPGPEKKPDAKPEPKAEKVDNASTIIKQATLEYLTSDRFKEQIREAVRLGIATVRGKVE